MDIHELKQEYDQLKKQVEELKSQLDYTQHLYQSTQEAFKQYRDDNLKENSTIPERWIATPNGVLWAGKKDDSMPIVGIMLDPNLAQAVAAKMNETSIETDEHS